MMRAKRMTLPPMMSIQMHIMKKYALIFSHRSLLIYRFTS